MCHAASPVVAAVTAVKASLAAAKDPKFGFADYKREQCTYQNVRIFKGKTLSFNISTKLTPYAAFGFLSS